MARDASDSLHLGDMLGRDFAPLPDSAVSAIDRPRDADQRPARQTPEHVPKHCHASSDSTTNSPTQAPLVAVLCGGAARLAENGRMAKMRSRLKENGPRHFVRQWRKYRHLTQEQLAERIGSTHGAISQLETGRTSYTQGMLEALADALMCEPADLLMRDPSQDQMIWSLWDKLGEAEKRQAVRLIQAISGDKAA